jgi:hypothetical protein
MGKTKDVIQWGKYITSVNTALFGSTDWGILECFLEEGPLLQEFPRAR